MDLFTGADLKEEGIRRAADANREILAALRSHLAKLASTGAIVSADDARWWLESHPEGERFLSERKDWMGALFRTGEWEAVGWVISKASANHARPIRSWRLKSFGG